MRSIGERRRILSNWYGRELIFALLTTVRGKISSMRGSSQNHGVRDRLRRLTRSYDTLPAPTLPPVPAGWKDLRSLTLGTPRVGVAGPGAQARLDQLVSLLTGPFYRFLSNREALIEWAVVGVVFAVLGYLLAPLARSPSVFPDSGTVLSISRKLADGDWRPIWDTQSPLVQDSVYAALLAMGWSVLSCPPAIASFGLAVLLGFFAYRATGDRLATVIPSFVLMFSTAFWTQAGYLTMYAGFVLLGWAGLYVSLGYVLRGGSVGKALGGAALLAAGVYTFTTAIVFFLPLVLAVLLFYSRDAVRRLAGLLLMVGWLIGPWIIWHLKVGGIRYFYYHPLNWFAVKYLGVVNTEFWHHDQTSVLSYGRTLFGVAFHDLISPGLLLFVVPGMWYVRRRLGGKAVLLCLACLVGYATILLITRPAPYARYFYPILPMVVLLASAGIWVGVENVRSAFGRLGPVVVVLLASSLLLLGEVPSPVATAQHRYVERLDSSPGYKDFVAVASAVRTSDGGVIARDSAIQALVPNNQVFTHYLLTEDEYVTFLSWRDDASVVDVLRGQNIEWVLLYNDLRWERDYHVWLMRAYGVEPMHYERISTSPFFELVYHGERFQLYRLKPEAPVLTH